MSAGVWAWAAAAAAAGLGAGELAPRRGICATFDGSAGRAWASAFLRARSFQSFGPNMVPVTVIKFTHTSTAGFRVFS